MRCHRRPRRTTVGGMSAQPTNAGPAQAPLPRTIRAIGGALPEDKRAEFAAELEDTEAAGLALVGGKRLSRAVVWSSPQPLGTLGGVPARTLGPGPARPALAARAP